MRRRHISEREQLSLFRALSGDLAPRDAQDLMAYPFFSLAKSRRVVPIDFRAGKIAIRVEAVPEHGMATIWDADVLIWAASQIVEARDGGLKTSRLMAATPYEILTFVGRGTSVRDYDRLKAALDRLQSTTVMTSIRQSADRRRHRFSWINEWNETADVHGRPRGLELILPDWFYAGVLDDALVLTIDRAYFDLTGGLERWLYRVVRKHGGSQKGGWSFDFAHLHAGNPAACRRSNILPTTCARSSAVRHCRATNSSLSAARAATSVWPLRRLPPISHCGASAQARSECSPGGKPAESVRAIGDDNRRANGDPILVLSGTRIWMKPSWHLNGLAAARNFTNRKFLRIPSNEVARFPACW